MRPDTPFLVRLVLSAFAWFLGVFALNVMAEYVPVGLMSGLGVALGVAALTLGCSALLGAGKSRHAAAAACGAAALAAGYYLAISIATVMRDGPVGSFYAFWPAVHVLTTTGLLLAIAKSNRPSWRVGLPMVASTVLLAGVATARLSGAADAPPSTSGYVWLAGLLVGSALGAAILAWRLRTGGPSAGSHSGELAV